ncbi:acetyl-CoA carboxylase biotin carboxylase subunit [Enterovibrio norvegicus]|nr:acetyl-CoA carboxylase biotin carboxylase subunit [Enterovibrio norvegicus]PML81926.1 acetyl-CoA carboxylase biotin carboxylase subunit [Enterovibrio norvegicus]
MAIKRMLVANRGEIAVRIIRAARELGIESVQVYSEADADSLAVKLADKAVCIGPPKAAKSYLNIDAIMAAAQHEKVDAIHPGYGFLSENAEFADAVVKAGMIFVGPSGLIMRKMGDKATAKKTAKQAGVPTVPGSDGRVESLDIATAVAAEIGYPVMIKASAGGGGRGIRVVNSLEELAEQFHPAQAEAAAAFGDGGLYVEKLITGSRHIEFQLLADGKRAVHLFERECSLQRRRQKVWEEAPSAVLSPSVRASMGKAAAALAESVGYCGAGTVEYLYNEKNGEFYFIEMNTRIQVEHPATEWITGVDLVREMILVADGQPLPFTQDELSIKGHAIEVRINAEDPTKDFMPFPGKVENLSIPQGPGVRFDSLLYPGYAISPFYDSLLGKLIIWDTDRDKAIARLDRALSELSIGGVKTTKPLFVALSRDPDVQAGRFDTKWLESWLSNYGATLDDSDILDNTSADNEQNVDALNTQSVRA